MRRILAIALGASVLLVGCSSDKGGQAEGVDKPAETTAVPQDNTQGIAATGSAFLNGFQILPAGTTAVCAKHEDTTTIIIGDMPSKNAASVIMDGKGVRALSIADAEDNVEFTDYSVPVEVTSADGLTTISGQAEGTRVYGSQTQQLDMTFIITVTCV